MPQVTCPQCHQTLAIPRDVHNAKLKCRKCGAVFVASTVGAGSERAPEEALRAAGGAEETPDDALSGLAREHEMPGLPPLSVLRSRPPRRRASPVAMAFTIAGLVAVVVGVILAGYLYMYPYYEEVVDGKVVRKGRFPREEVVRLKAEADQRAMQGMLQRPGEEPAAPTPDPTPRVEPRPTPRTQGGTTNPTPTPPAPLARDPKIRIRGEHAVPVAGQSYGSVVADVANDYPEPVVSLTVAFYIVDPKGARLALPPQTVEYIPAGGHVPVSVSYNAVLKETIASVAYSVTDVKTDPGLICLPQDDLYFDADARKLKGDAQNTSREPVMKPQVVVEFVDDDGAVIGHTKVESLEGFPLRMDPGRRVFLNHDPKLPAYIAPAKVIGRLIGRRE